MKLIFLSCWITGILFVSCQYKQKEVVQISTIDSTMQVNVTSILENKLSEINALSGQVIIMEVQTGHIKTLVGLTRKDSTNYQPCNKFSIQRPTGLMNPISILAALETGKVKLDDAVDTGNGIYSFKGGAIKDHNWNRGGYGEITVKQGLACNSNIATVKATLEAFKDNPMSYVTRLHQMGMGDLDKLKYFEELHPIRFMTKDSIWRDTDLAFTCIGYNLSIAPVQILTFYNAIANNGRMITPQLYKDSIIVINPQIASKVSIDSLKQALLFNITDGLGKPAYSDKAAIAGIQGTTLLTTNEDSTKNEYAAEFYGYFPADNPKYSIIVSINKTGLPVSGGLMAGDIFRQIAEYIINLK
nr:penicillin-binding transpeptidase domain-containing protein [Bacteroides oleiciplenus]